MLLAINGAFEDGKAFAYDTLDISGMTYGGADPTPGYAALAAFGNNGTVVAKSSGGGGSGGGDGPEPTSGILLLVGAGILGLRRKRA